MRNRCFFLGARLATLDGWSCDLASTMKLWKLTSRAAKNMARKYGDTFRAVAELTATAKGF